MNVFKNKVALFFGSASLLKVFVGMLGSFIAIRYIGPEQMGLWQAALVIKPYINIIQLGLTQGIGREIPFFLGRKEDKKVNEIASTAQLVTIGYTLLTLLITFLAAFFVAENSTLFLVYLTAGTFISTMFVDNYLSSTYRSSQSFQKLSKVYLITSITFICLIPLIVLYKFEGYLILLLIDSILTTLMLIYFRPIKVKSRFSLQTYKYLIKTGSKIFFLTYLRNIPETYPKLIILFFLSTYALGLTAPANAVLSGISLVPNTLAKYIYPKITFNYGRDSDKSKVWDYSIRIIKNITVFGFLCLLSIIIIPFIINNFFPKYDDAVYISMISVGIAFFRMYGLLFNVLITLKRHKAQLAVGVSRNVLYLLIPLLLYLLYQEHLLEGIFIGILIAEAVSTALLIYFVHKVTHER